MNKTLKPFFQPAFVVCVVILATAAASQEVVLNLLDISLTKKALPLRKSLDDLDRDALGPYRVIQERKIENFDVLESLGTEDYIEWVLEDTEAASVSPVRYCSFFVTYYTGNPDQVPHVPDECYIGSGNQQMGADQVVLTLADSTRETTGHFQLPDQLKIRQLAFSAIQSQWRSSEFFVQYFFKVNGDYAATRNETRAVMAANLFSEYSYFSKVEWRFFGQAFNRPVYGNPEEIKQASEKLMKTVLPLLESQHWPDWKQANQKP